MPTIVFGGGFLALAAAVFLLPRAVQRFDDAALARLSFFATPRWSNALKPVSFFGGALGVAAVAIVATFLVPLSVIEAERLAIAILGSAAMAQLIKLAAARARPHEHPWLPPFPEYSFPSGHATAVTALYGFLGITLYLSAGAPLDRALALVVPTAVIIAVGFSRLALSAHFLLDVIGGCLLGAFWISFALLVPL